MIGLEYYIPTPEQAENMGRIALDTRCSKIVYKQIDTQYLAYHPKCGMKKLISKETLGQIKSSHVCPFCLQNIEGTTTKHQEGHQFIRISSNDESYGYYVYYDLDLEKGLFSDYEQVLYASGNDCYHRFLGFDLFARNLSLAENKPDWKYSKRKRFSSYYYQERYPYEDAMFDYKYRLGLLVSKTKKQFLEENAYFITKSNQKKIVIDNVFNSQQMKFIKVFDLKSAEQVKKYYGYINKDKNHIDDFLRDGIELNVFYLDYLSRKKINLGTYYTFLHNLKSLGFKYEKPTDFKFRNEAIEKMCQDAKDEEVNKKIMERYDELPKYSEKNIVIEPFKSAYEIRKCGKELHNCIGGFVSKYSTKLTDIYHLDLDYAIKVAIEIKDKKLVQAYEDNNSNCRKEYMKHIKSFCKTNGFSLGRYA